VTVVGAERKPVVGAAIGDALTLLKYQGFHNAVHIDITIKVVGFVEVAILVATSSPEVDKVDAMAQPVDHANQIVVGPNAVTARAKTKAIVLAIGSFEQLSGISFGTNHTRQAQNRVGGVVGVNGQ